MFDDYVAENILVEIVSNLNDIEEIYTRNFEEIKHLDGLITDLLHAIEFGEFDIEQGYEYAKTIKETRMRRRKLKDQNQILFPAYEMLNKEPATKQKFINLMEKTKRVARMVNDQKYIPRTDDPMINWEEIFPDKMIGEEPN